MNGRIIGYVKIYDETEQGAIQIQFRAPLRPRPPPPPPPPPLQFVFA